MNMKDPEHKTLFLELIKTADVAEVQAEKFNK